MSKLASFQEQIFRIVLAPEAQAKQFAKQAFKDSEDGWEYFYLYRSIVIGSIHRFLSSVFRVTAAYLHLSDEQEFWNKMIEGFCSEVLANGVEPLPSQSLKWVGFRFPEFFAKHQREAWLSELCDYEWALGSLSLHKETPPAAWLNPTLALREYRYPIAQWYRKVPKKVFATEEGKWKPSDWPTGQRIAPAKGTDTQQLAIFLPQSSSTPKTVELPAPTFALLQLWADGSSLEDSAQDLAQALGVKPDHALKQIQQLILKLKAEGICA